MKILKVGVLGLLTILFACAALYAWREGWYWSMCCWYFVTAMFLDAMVKE